MRGLQGTQKAQKGHIQSKLIRKKAMMAGDLVHSALLSTMTEALETATLRFRSTLFSALKRKELTPSFLSWLSFAGPDVCWY